MNLSFSAEETTFAAEVRAFLARELTPALLAGAAASPGIFADQEVAMAWQRILHAHGWLAYDWPLYEAGTGWSPIQRYIFEKECALAGAPALPGMGLKLVGPVIYTFGTAAQKATHLPPLLAGETFWAQGFSEPGAGSDLARLRTRAVKVPGGYKINGSKIWTTRAQYANRIFCLVRTGHDEKPQAGITFLLVDMAQQGISVRPIVSLSGEYEVNEVFFDDVFTPDDWRIGAEGDGWSIAKFLLKNERGKACFAPALLADIAALRRKAAASPAIRTADRHAIRQRIATLSAEAEALEITELRTLDELHRGEPPGPQSLMTKLIASEIRQGIEEAAMALHGPAGLRLPWPRGLSEAGSQAARYLDSRAWTIFGGTSEIQLNIIARSVLNL